MKLDEINKPKIILYCILGIAILGMIIICMKACNKGESKNRTNQNANLSKTRNEGFTHQEMLNHVPSSKDNTEGGYGFRRSGGYSFSNDTIATDDNTDAIYQDESEDVKLLQESLRQLEQRNNQKQNTYNPPSQKVNLPKQEIVEKKAIEIKDTQVQQVEEQLAKIDEPARRSRFFRGNRKVDKGNAILALVEGEQKVGNSERIKIRLLEDMTLDDDKVIKKGTTIWGVSRLTAERAEIKLETILIGRDIIDVKRIVYDQDGLQGINIPASLKAEIAKRAAARTIQSADNPNIGESGGLLNKSVNAVSNTAKSLIAKDVESLTYELPTNYRIFLK